MGKPLHGGPVSPWPRRARRLVRWCFAVISTIALAAIVGLVALVCADALGAMGTPVVSLALLIGAVVLYALAGLALLTVALTCALTLVATSHWLGLDLLAVLDTVLERIAGRLSTR